MRKLIVSLTAVFFLVLSAAAQDRTISGVVTNEKNLPLAGVSVGTPDGKSGTQTDNDGKYSIKIPASAKVLIFSYVNYQSATLAVGKLLNLSVSLKPADTKLEEVVVVGYGTQQKKAFTGSSAKVDAKQFANLVTPSVDKQLAGRAAGVQVTNAGGLINAPARIRIRGTNSINQNQDPLIVVDGTPIISGNLAATTNSNTLGDINPSDIENIEVLKDGSATAIYGSRAAGGVVLITTKRGTKGKSKITYDAFVGYSGALKRFDLLNAADFITIANEKLRNAGLAARANTNPAAGAFDTDWQGMVMNKNATVMNHTISLQGGGDKTTYYFSLNYSDQKGIIISNYNKSYRVRMNIEHEANKFFKIGNNTSISRQEDGDQNNGSNALGGSIASALRLLPNVSPYAATASGWNINYPANGNMQPGANSQSVDDNFSNVAFTLRYNKNYSDKYRLINNTFMEFAPVKGLKFRTQLGVDMLNDYSYQGLTPLHGDGFGTAAGGTNGSLYNADQTWLRFVISNYINYNLTLARKHNFFLTAGHELQKETYKFLSANATNISDLFYIKENLITGAGSIQTVGGNYDKNSLESLFGRFNYDFKNKYFLQASVRRDGISSLAPGKKYGVFPGLSVGWRPSQEKFWKNSPILSKGINEFKIKGSYGKVGNPLGGYQYLSTFGSANYGNIGGIAPSAVGNPNLQWETSTKYDIGAEMQLFNGRMTLTADWFKNDISNVVLRVPTPPSAGVPGNAISQNIGTMENKGIELSLGFNVMNKKEFSWDINFNYSNVQNKVTKLYNVGGVPVPFIDGAYNIIKVGQPINIIYGYEYAGVNSANGNPMYYKADGSLIQMNLNAGGVIGGYYYALSKSDPNLGVRTTLSTDDRKKLGSGIPVWFGALTNTFRYKGFEFEFMLRYSGGNKIMNITSQEALFNQSFQNNGKEILTRWTKPGDITSVPKLFFGAGNAISLNQNANSRFVEKGDYLRLQNVVFSYTLDSKRIEERTNGIVKSVRFFTQGQNLYVWTKYKGADPDNISAAGLDAAVSPQLRTISMGISLGF